MVHTRIPPASSQDDRIDDFLAATERDLYVLEEAATRKVLIGGLNKRQLMEVVWTLHGRDYRVERRMGTALDDIGRSTGAVYQLADLFGPEWDVYFKNGATQPWRKSRLTAFGVNEREAIFNLLDEGFRRAAWDDYFYVRLQGVTDLREIGAPSKNTPSRLGPC
ncbi:hypothetical protein ACWV27_22000 [Massilia varians]